MEAQDYLFAWIVYLTAALLALKISWGVLKKYLLRELAYLLQGFLVAILFTPWYVLEDQDILAPAFIIFLMDSITLNSTAGIRALPPLVMAMLLAFIISLVMSIVYRLRNRRRIKHND